MAEVVEFPRPRGESRRIVVALEDELFAFLSTTRFVENEHVVEYVPASTLEDPDSEADLWLGPYVRSAEGRKLFFQTLSGAVYEFDTEGRVWRGSELVSSGDLVDFGVPATNERGLLRPAHPAALLFMTPAGSGWDLRVRVTTPVLLVAHLPAVSRRIEPPRRWLSLARRLAHDGGAS